MFVRRVVKEVLCGNIQFDVYVKIYRLIKNVLVGKPEGKRPLGRLRLRLEDNINMDLQEVGLERGRDWIDLVRDGGRWREIVYVVMILRVP
jgi:hypothetical protein